MRVHVINKKRSDAVTLLLVCLVSNNLSEAMRKLTLLLFSSFILTYAVRAQIPAGFVASYPLDNTATDLSGNGYNGSLTNTSATTNRLGAANKATSFAAGTSTGQLPLALVTALQNDFSIAFWFRTTMTAPASGQWYGGTAMVDAEVCGGTSDWGTALIDGGKRSLGIGNPDITIKSINSYNDGNWHFATAVRNQAAGSITLYVDGAQQATSTGTSTSSLIAPSFIGFGMNPCNPSILYTGGLDDIIAYNRVLSASEISNIYTYMTLVALPLRWVSFKAVVKETDITLKWTIDQAVGNKYFETEHSSNGIQFNHVGTVAATSATSAVSDQLDYMFDYRNAVQGAHYFRIKQVDADGRFSFSKTIVVSIKLANAGIKLQTNPVQNTLVINNTEQKKIQQVLITDRTGRTLKLLTLQSNNISLPVDVQQLPAGSYLLQMKLANGENYSIMFIKQ